MRKFFDKDAMKKNKHWLFALFLLFVLIPIISNYYAQEDLLFKFSPIEETHVYTFPQEFEEMTFNVAENAKISCVLFKIPNPKGVVMYYHGQKSNILKKWKVITNLFHHRGYDVMMMEYRGFGKSRGKMSEANLYSDAFLPYQYLVNRYGENHIVVYGCSLGTGVASKIASQTNPKLLLLESPYYNMIELGKYTKPYFPKFVISLVLKYPLRTDLFLDDVNAPTVLFHGTADKIIPYKHSQMLYNQYKNDKRIKLVTLENATHKSIIHEQNFHHVLDEVLQ